MVCTSTILVVLAKKILQHESITMCSQHIRNNNITDDAIKMRGTIIEQRSMSALKVVQVSQCRQSILLPNCHISWEFFCQEIYCCDFRV